ncbi:hypothetical protein [Streptomyces sp. ODS28]|uniref:hypothetical protein n=1 Tax=Streptomyces sp. ODS28 TaxID=3136688 RepID=UPI0031ED5248
MRTKSVAGVGAITVILSLSFPTAAYAGYKDHKTEGRNQGTELSASAQTQVKLDKTGVPDKGAPITPVDTDWTPPACWYEPFATPKQFKHEVDSYEKEKRIPTPSLGLNTNTEGMRQQYKDNKDVLGGPAYKNYNLDKQGKGKWWRAVVNPNRAKNFNFFRDGSGCGDLIFWAKPTKAPKAAGISPKVLAGYAYDSIKVPDTKVTLNPKGKSTVNLPTWMWLDKAKFKPVEVTATLPGTGLSATTTAKPKSLHLDPGTPDAKVFPSTGECPVNKDGTIGKPYTKGNSKKNPPCGVTYEHATTNAPPHQLKATVTWDISWKGPNNEGGNLPDGAFDTTQNIPVQEVQSIN